MGDEVVAAEPPEWSEVFEQAQELLGRTKDLRVAVHLVRAAVNKTGVPGLADGLALISGLLEQYWDTVHPVLDAEDDNDPTFRVNSVLPLSDKGGLLGDILMMPLVSSRAVGRFSLRDVRVAKGELQPLADQESVPDAALIHAAFMDVDLDTIQEDAQAVDSAIESANRIDAIYTENVGGAYSPDLAGLHSELKMLKIVYAENLLARGVGVEMPEGEGAIGGGEPAAAAISGEVRSREDAIRMIEKICSYFERNEPSSPVPMLLQRVKRLIPMDFLEIMRELTPDAVAQAEAIAGIKPDDGY
jgi:type VI secretion system protein ImpA